MEVAVQAELRIRLLADGRLMVEGPITNAVLAYGLLEVAKDVVRQAGAAPSPPRVVPIHKLPAIERPNGG